MVLPKDGNSLCTLHSTKVVLAVLTGNRQGQFNLRIPHYYNTKAVVNYVNRLITLKIIYIKTCNVLYLLFLEQYYVVVLRDIVAS